MQIKAGHFVSSEMRKASAWLSVFCRLQRHVISRRRGLYGRRAAERHIGHRPISSGRTQRFFCNAALERLSELVPASDQPCDVRIPGRHVVDMAPFGFAQGRLCGPSATHRPQLRGVALRDAIPPLGGTTSDKCASAVSHIKCWVRDVRRPRGVSPVVRLEVIPCPNPIVSS